MMLANATIEVDWGSAEQAVSSASLPIFGILAIFLVVGIAGAVVHVVRRAVDKRGDDD